MILRVDYAEAAAALAEEVDRDRLYRWVEAALPPLASERVRGVSGSRVVFDELHFVPAEVVDQVLRSFGVPAELYDGRAGG